MNIVSLALLAITGVTADGSHGTRASKTDMVERSGGARSSPAKMAERSGGTHHSKAEMADRSGGAHHSKAEMTERSGGFGKSTCSDVSGWSAQSGKSVSAKAALYACFNFQNEDDCSSNTGNIKGQQGLTANDACCACGGGVGVVSAPTTCLDVPGWYDSATPAYSCDDYTTVPGACSNEGHMFLNQGHTANSACCACGGGAGFTCSDVPNWYDSGFPAYSCDDYNTVPDACSIEGHLYLNQGYTATSACCTCGGGTCSDLVGWYDSDGPGYDCSWYEINDACATDGSEYENMGHTANSACCACRGPTGDSHCSDLVGWYDSDGPEFDCAWYELNDACATDGSSFENMGHTANSACCACK